MTQAETLAQKLLEAYEERDGARGRLVQCEDLLRRFMSESGHWHGCAVVFNNNPACSALCIEIRAYFGIDEPTNPYGGAR